MDIIIRNSGGVPIYDQITRQMKGLILRGEPQNPELGREDTLRRAEEHLSHAVDVAKAGGVTLAELTETLNLLYGDETL